MPSPAANPVVVLLGGGIESTALVERLLAGGENVIPVHVHCGLVWDNTEEQHVRRFLDERQCEQLHPLIGLRLPLTDWLGQHWAVTGIDVPRTGASTDRLEIPLRNLTLLSWTAARVAHLRELRLALGTTADNSYADGTRDYFDSCERLLSLESCRTVEILTPFISWDKTRVIRETSSRALAASFSCVDPQDHQHCGRCIKCGRRRNAFDRANIPDPTSYADD